MRPLVFNIYNIPQGVLAEQPVSVSMTTDGAIHLEDTSSFRVLHQIEPPEVFDAVDAIIEHHDFYDLILAWNKRILAACPNAKLFPLGNCSWIPWNTEGNNPPHSRPQNNIPHTECDISQKQFKASYLTSDKDWVEGHRLRLQIFDALPGMVGGLPITKHKSPPWLPDKRSLLESYQFFISAFNVSHDNWFDEKIIDPFLTKTIPLIWGCPNLSEFFNMDGVIRFQTVPELMERLAGLTPDYYMKHFDAVMDNYHRALPYTPIWTRIDREITAGIARKPERLWRPRR
jgi:Glycosyltransferase family 10 (fucosyltransferase) C-term